MQKETLLEIADICKLTLDDEEADKLLKEIQGILSYMEQLSEVISEEKRSEGLIIGLRDDVVSSSSPEMIRAQFPFSLDNKLKVPRGL